jgi:RyR domain
MEMTMTHDPKDACHANVQIPSDLLGLVEQLAEACHDIWSRQRLEDGWRYGPHRDDQKKEHPGLVPYQDLSETEKEYDRKVSLGIIKTILAWGYRIESPSSPASPDTPGSHD